jgi:hypothetical protein
MSKRKPQFTPPYTARMYGLMIGGTIEPDEIWHERPIAKDNRDVLGGKVVAVDVTVRLAKRKARRR